MKTSTLEEKVIFLHTEALAKTKVTKTVQIRTKIIAFSLPVELVKVKTIRPCIQIKKELIGNFLQTFCQLFELVIKAKSELESDKSQPGSVFLVELDISK